MKIDFKHSYHWKHIQLDKLIPITYIHTYKRLFQLATMKLYLQYSSVSCLFTFSGICHTEWSYTPSFCAYYIGSRYPLPERRFTKQFGKSYASTRFYNYQEILIFNYNIHTTKHDFRKVHTCTSRVSLIFKKCCFLIQFLVIFLHLQKFWQNMKCSKLDVIRIDIKIKTFCQFCQIVCRIGNPNKWGMKFPYNESQ